MVRGNNSSGISPLSVIIPHKAIPRPAMASLESRVIRAKLVPAKAGSGNPVGLVGSRLRGGGEGLTFVSRGEPQAHHQPEGGAELFSTRPARSNPVFTAEVIHPISV